MMRRRMWFGSIAVLVPILILAAIGAYALVASNDSGDGATQPGFALVKPVFAQGAFPDPDPGLSAYVDLNPTSVDFTDVVDNVFRQVFFAGDNYRIGDVIVPTSRNVGFPGNTSVVVHVYVDTDGLIIGYFPAGTINSQMFDFDEWDRTNPIIKTTLEDAMETVAKSTMGETIAGSPVSWYHWEHPSATHLLAVAKSINISSEKLFLSVPSSGINILGTPSYLFRRGPRISGCCSPDLVVERSDGQIVVNSSVFFDNLVLESNFIYTFRSSLDRDFSDVGIAIVYQVP